MTRYPTSHGDWRVINGEVVDVSRTPPSAPTAPHPEPTPAPAAPRRRTRKTKR